MITGKKTLNDIQNDEDLRLLVHTFYHRVQQDERLGYMFNEVAEVEWDTHLPKMVDFWSNLLFQSKRYKGRPFRRHLPLPIQRGDFDRWYGLWTETVDALFAGENAGYVKEMAGKIASSFSIRLEQEGKFEP
jgi:hemoglobin